AGAGEELQGTKQDVVALDGKSQSGAKPGGARAGGTGKTRAVAELFNPHRCHGLPNNAGKAFALAGFVGGACFSKMVEVPGGVALAEMDSLGASAVGIELPKDGEIELKVAAQG